MFDSSCRGVLSYKPGPMEQESVELMVMNCLQWRSVIILLSLF